MLRRSLAAVVVVLVVGSFVLAETVRGIVTKVSDKEVEIVVRKDKNDKEGTTKTYQITKDTKFFVAGTKGAEPREVPAEDFTKAFNTTVRRGSRGATLEVNDKGEVVKYTLGFSIDKKGKDKTDKSDK